MIMWMVTILFAVISLVFLFGKGSFLIAGYNTAGKEQKAMYDEKKLCRVMGSGMGIVTILIGIGAALDENMPDFYTTVMVVGILAVTVAMAILSNTVCKAKTTESVTVTAEEKVKQRNVQMISLVIAGLITIAVFIFLVTGDVKTVLSGDMLKIEATYWDDAEVALNTIRSVTYTDELDTGSRKYGLGSFKLALGRFENEQFGKYTLYSYKGCKSYVILETDSGTVVINEANETETKQLYEQLLSRIGE